MGGGYHRQENVWASRIGISILMALFFSSLSLPFAFGDQVIEYIQKAPQKTSTRKKACSVGQQHDAYGNILCRYYQANDNLTLQALYLTEKLSRTDDAIKNQDEDQALTALGAFCKAAESAANCFPRYKAFQALALSRIRQAIGNNEDSIARLTSKRKNDGTVSGTAHVFESELKADYYVPEVPRMSDLETEFKRNGRIKIAKKVSHGDVLKWTQEAVNPDPRTKFNTFKSTQVTSNPHSSSSTDKLNMLERDADGKVKVDANLDRFAQGKVAELKRELSSATAAEKAHEVDFHSPSELKTHDKISYEAIQEARHVMVEKLNQELAKKSGAPLDPAAQNQKSVDVKTGAPIAVRKIGDEETVKRPLTTTSHTYIKYDLGMLFQDIQTLTQ